MTGDGIGQSAIYSNQNAIFVIAIFVIKNMQMEMTAPEIETSTREERLGFIRDEFKCLGNCPICGKCSFLRGREAEDIYSEYIDGLRSFREITAEHRNISIIKP